MLIGLTRNFKDILTKSEAKQIWHFFEKRFSGRPPCKKRSVLGKFSGILLTQTEQLISKPFN